MKNSEINYLKTASFLGLIPDDENALFIFGQTHKNLLIDIINGKLDVKQLARMEMQNRGLDIKTGTWIGWNTNKKMIPA